MKELGSIVFAEVLDLIGISLATIFTNLSAPNSLLELVGGVAVMVVLDVVNEGLEVFGIELGAHAVGHVGEDGISTSTGASEEFPTDGSVLFNLIVHDPVAIFLLKAFLSVPDGIVVKAH